MNLQATNQRGYSPGVFWTLIGLSVAALLAADHWLTPTLNTSTLNVQWFFRLLALIVVLCGVLFAFLKRKHEEEETGQIALTGD